MESNTAAEAGTIATNAVGGTVGAVDQFTQQVVVQAGRWKKMADTYSAKAVQVAPNVVFAFIIFGVFWILAKVARKAIFHLTRKLDASAHDAVELMARTASFGLMAFGTVLALDNAGVNVGPLIAGLGLTGFALGFAVKDALTNVLCGVLIIFYRPYKRGDRIVVTGIEGVVKALDLRYTTIEAEGKVFLVPNTTMFNSTITILRQA